MELRIVGEAFEDAVTQFAEHRRWFIPGRGFKSFLIEKFYLYFFMYLIQLYPF